MNLNSENENENKNIAFVARSAKSQPDIKALSKEWHLRLEHASFKTIAHLQKVAKRVKLIGKNSIAWNSTTIQCKTCNVSKVKQIISC